MTNRALHILKRSCLTLFLLCLSVWVLFVRLYPIHGKTAEPIGPKFCEGPHMTPMEKFLDVQNFENPQ